LPYYERNNVDIAVFFLMARPENTQDSVEIRISTTRAVRQYVQQLVDTGLWGKNVTEAAERLLGSTLAQMLRSGELQRLPPNNDKPEQ
jgi:hypothetical protein